MIDNKTTVSLYVVRTANGKFFGGFDAAKGVTTFVESALEGKKFSNKNDIRLRPDEMLVELSVDLAKVQVNLSEPFRPHRKPVRAGVAA